MGWISTKYPITRTNCARPYTGATAVTSYTGVRQNAVTYGINTFITDRVHWKYFHLLSNIFICYQLLTIWRFMISISRFGEFSIVWVQIIKCLLKLGRVSSCLWLTKGMSNFLNRKYYMKSVHGIIYICCQFTLYNY